MVDDEVIVGFDTRRLNELFGEDRAADVVDVLIVGAGPAGLTAGVDCARKGLTAVLIATIDRRAGPRVLGDRELHGYG